MKINIGGESKKEGWKILNVQKKPDVDFIGNINNLDQFENECCEEIYASHVIEHIDQKTVLNTLKGINRILKKMENFIFQFQIWILYAIFLLVH